MSCSLVFSCYFVYVFNEGCMSYKYWMLVLCCEGMLFISIGKII